VTDHWYPWVTLREQVAWRIDSITLPERAFTTTPDQESAGYIDLSDHLDEGWESAVVSISGTLDKDAIKAIGRSVDDIECVVTVEARLAYLRYGVPLTVEPDGRLHGVIPLRRTEVRGVVRLTLLVVGRVDDVDDRHLGAGKQWRVVVDAGPESLGKVPFDVMWAEFEQPEGGLEFLTEHRRAPFFFDARSGAPVLYLNRSIPDLEQTLNLKRPRGMKKVVQDLIAESIATKVFYQLAVAAIDDIDLEDGEPVSRSESDLYQNLWKVLAEKMPSVGSPAELRRNVAQIKASADAGEFRQLMATIGVAVEAMCGTNETLTKAAEGVFAT